MQPDIRRIIAVDAHRRKSGRCPAIVHSLGTGETFAIEATEDGFIDKQSGIRAHVGENTISLPAVRGTIDIAVTAGLEFSGFDHVSGEVFSGIAGGGTSVTVYDSRRVDYFQYAVAEAA